MSSVTIVMYHYVRDKESRYPELKFLERKNFISQLDFLQKNYEIITAENIVQHVQGEKALPDRACLLTFDDGYLDHYLNVFPELYKRGIQGSFYPPCMATERTKVMEVNKIQLILASAGYAHIDKIIKEFRAIYLDLQKKGEHTDLEDLQSLYSQYAKASRFDSADVMFIKKMLQYALPHTIRSYIIDKLYDLFVGVDENIMARELYMSIDMLKVMAKSGMHIGSHGSSHVWLNKISAEQQEKEVDDSLSMLEKVYDSKDFMWTMCYPFGGNDASLRTLCEARHCAFALTTVPEIAHVSPETRFTLSRIDTNDLPPIAKEKI